MSDTLFLVALLLFLGLPVGFITGIVLALFKRYAQSDRVFLVTMIASVVGPICALAGQWHYLNFGPPAGEEAVGSGLFVAFALLGGALTFAACATARYLIDRKLPSRPPHQQ